MQALSVEDAQSRVLGKWWDGSRSDGPVSPLLINRRSGIQYPGLQYGAPFLSSSQAEGRFRLEILRRRMVTCAFVKHLRRLNS